MQLAYPAQDAALSKVSLRMVTLTQPSPSMRDANHGNVGADLRVCPGSNPIMLEIMAAFTVLGG